jgi:hypothetical protein
MSMHGAMFFTPTENLDLWGFEDPNENFVQLGNSVSALQVTKWTVF